MSYVIDTVSFKTVRLPHAIEMLSPLSLVKLHMTSGQSDLSAVVAVVLPSGQHPNSVISQSAKRLAGLVSFIPMVSLPNGPSPDISISSSSTIGQLVLFAFSAAV